MKIIKISEKEMNTRYTGIQNGRLRGAFYALYEEGKGFYSFDGKTAYKLSGASGKRAMQSIIDDGGFIGEMKFVNNF